MYKALGVFMMSQGLSNFHGVLNMELIQRNAKMYFERGTSFISELFLFLMHNQRKIVCIRPPLLSQMFLIFLKFSIRNLCKMKKNQGS